MSRVPNAAVARARAIAQAAGVAEGTIYRHLPDKMALFGLATGKAAAGATLEDAEVTSAVRLLVRGIQPS